MSKFQAPRGTHDVLPGEQPAWQLVTRTLAEVAEQYGYRRIQTPNLEDTEVFARTSGAGSDVVQKEMYTFDDRGGRSLTLKPEGTAGIARAYIEHGMQQLPQPVKLYTVAPMYRYEAPQKGRYREHWQVSVEAFGSDDPAVDAEVIDLYAEVLRRLGITRYVLELNSIGDRECRPTYLEQLNAWLDAHDEVLDEDARLKRARSPLRVFDVKSERVQTALQDAPKIGDHLCKACGAHFAEVRRLLDALGIAYTLNPTLVRGLDYYTRTVFEFLNPEEKAQPQICSGGRYDYLVEELGGTPTPGVGFGAGIERLLIALEAEGRTPEAPTIDVFFAVDDGAERERVLEALARLRHSGVSADTDYAGRSMKGQLTQAQRLGAETVVVARSDGTYEVRRRGEEDRVVHSLSEL
ncbi:MAG TPA: histidine--tRNA ligase [Gaiellaceae bacterium]|jgi:histidyl-tRNA synthetase|nr:histidine--tRNA ligase [Gaiellaceae bacterium]